MNDDKWFDRFFVIFMIASVLTSTIVFGVGVWAVIELVQWVKTK